MLIECLGCGARASFLDDTKLVVVLKKHAGADTNLVVCGEKSSFHTYARATVCDETGTSKVLILFNVFDRFKQDYQFGITFPAPQEYDFLHYS